jgi:hypothetical protein
VKLRIGPMLGFKRFKTAAITIAGIELLLRIRKGQSGRLDCVADSRRLGLRAQPQGTSYPVSRPRACVMRISFRGDAESSRADPVCNSYCTSGSQRILSSLEPCNSAAVDGRIQ